MILNLSEVNLHYSYVSRCFMEASIDMPADNARAKNVRDKMFGTSIKRNVRDIHQKKK